MRSATDSAAMNLRMATMQLVGMRIPPRVRTIPPLRRRLAIAMVTDSPQEVIIRQAVHNVDTSLNGTQPTQNQRA